MCLRRRQVRLGDDVEQPYLQRSAGRLKRTLAVIGESQGLAAAVVPTRGALDQAGVAQGCDQLGDGGARHTGPPSKLGAPDVLLGDRAQRQVLARGQWRLVVCEQPFDPAGHERGDAEEGVSDL